MDEIETQIIISLVLKNLIEGWSFALSLSKAGVKKNKRYENLFRNAEIKRLQKLYNEGYFKK